jgi:hypothetical protein
MHVFPSGVKATDVIMSGTEAENATVLSGILQSRNFASREPARKNRSSVGWNCMEGTKSECLNVHRFSSRLTCHKRTVLSMDEDSKKLF